MCSLDVAQPSQTVRDCPRPSAWGPYGRTYMGSSATGVIFGGFTGRVFSFYMAGVACRDIETFWVTCRKSFCEQAQYFCDVIRRCIAFFFAGAALWTCPSVLCVAGTVLQTCQLACFLRIAVSGLRKGVTRCKLRGRRGIL